MKSSTRIVWSVAAAGLIAVSLADAQSKSTVRETMRTKLHLAQDVLEGITTENFGLITTNAVKLRALSNSADWWMRNTAEYQQLTAEYARSAEALEKAARKRSADSATLAYFQLTSSCVNCHRYLRGAAEARVKTGSGQDEIALAQSSR
jgi:hypothetical protein